MEFKYSGDVTNLEQLQSAWDAHASDAVESGDYKSSSLNSAARSLKESKPELLNPLKNLVVALLREQRISPATEETWHFTPNTLGIRNNLGDAMSIVVRSGKTEALNLSFANIRQSFASSRAVQEAVTALEYAITPPPAAVLAQARPFKIKFKQA